MSTNFSAQNSVKPTSTHCGGKIAHCNVPGATTTMSILGAHTTTDPDANAIGAPAASAPSTTSPIPYCTEASGRCHTGFLRPFCYASLVRPDALRGRWVFISRIVKKSERIALQEV